MSSLEVMKCAECGRESRHHDFCSEECMGDHEEREQQAVKYPPLAPGSGRWGICEIDLSGPVDQNRPRPLPIESRRRRLEARLAR